VTPNVNKTITVTSSLPEGDPTTAHPSVVYTSYNDISTTTYSGLYHTNLSSTVMVTGSASPALNSTSFPRSTVIIESSSSKTSETSTANSTDDSITRPFAPMTTQKPPNTTPTSTNITRGVTTVETTTATPITKENVETSTASTTEATSLPIRTTSYKVVNTAPITLEVVSISAVTTSTTTESTTEGCTTDDEIITYTTPMPLSPATEKSWTTVSGNIETTTTVQTKDSKLITHVSKADKATNLYTMMLFSTDITPNMTGEWS